jgi:ABC-type uncharacterized transport system substrate-binding protein
MLRACGLLLSSAVLTLLPVSTPAHAHPHVWVTVASEIVYGPNGIVNGVRHHWTFDDMFSAFATQGLDTDKDGKLSREELAGLAEVNVTSLKEFDFFTHAKGDGRKVALSDPKDYWLEHTNNLLTLHFTLPVKNPAQLKAFEIDIYDATYFVDFALREKDAVKLVDAPATCKLSSFSKKDAGTQSRPLSESFFNSLDANSAFGAQFANKISVACP